MKKAKKIVALALTVAMVAGVSVAGTMAWLSAKTDPVKNTFSVGQLFDLPETPGTGEPTKTMEIKEAKVVPTSDGYDKPGDNPEYESVTEGIKYENLPGDKASSVYKGVQINVNYLVQNAYVFAKITNDTGLTVPTPDSNTWEKLSTKEENATVYAYKTVVNAGSDSNPQKLAVELFAGEIAISADQAKAAGTDGSIGTGIKVEMYVCQAIQNPDEASGTLYTNQETWDKVFEGKTT